VGSIAQVHLVDEAAGTVLDQPLPVMFDTAWPPLTGGLVTALAAQHGLRALVREPLDFLTVQMAAAPGQPAPPGCRWLPAPPPAPYWRPPWYQPGWFAEAAGYLDRVLVATGRRRTGDWEQVKQWSLSAVLRQPTDRGDLYLKAVLPRHGFEATLTTWLAGQSCGPFGVIVDHDQSGSRWVAEDFDGVGTDSSDAMSQAAIVAALARLQLAMIGRSDELARAGVRRRSLADLAAAVPAVLNRADLWSAPPALANAHRTIDPSAVDRLIGLGPLLERCLIELDRLALPPTLVHGDFHAGNAVLRTDGVLLHDLSFATIGLPLLDLAWPYFDGPPAAAVSAVQTWIAVWSAVIDPSRLRKAWRFARPVAAFAELSMFVDLLDLVGPEHAFNFLAITYRWARRLLRATADTV
jgi:hypothetical protein